MAYPSLPQAEGSTMELVDPLLLDTARSGTSRGRRLQSSAKHKFNLVHTLLTPTQLGTLLAWIAAHRIGTDSFTWAGDGNVYVVMLIGDSTKYKPTVNLLWEVQLTLLEA